MNIQSIEIFMDLSIVKACFRRKKNCALRSNACDNLLGISACIVKKKMSFGYFATKQLSFFQNLKCRMIMKGVKEVNVISNMIIIKTSGMERLGYCNFSIFSFVPKFTDLLLKYNSSSFQFLMQKGGEENNDGWETVGRKHPKRSHKVFTTLLITISSAQDMQSLGFRFYMFNGIISP